MNTLETELDTSTGDNLKLKSLNFDLEYRINHYAIQIDTASKKIKMLNDRYAKMTKDLEQA
jgi:chaperonin cofactor prefoldin